MSFSLSQTTWMRLSPDSLKQHLTHSGLAHPGAVEIHPLTGDASTRRYFRLTLHDPKEDSDPSSLMAMQLEEPIAGEMDWLLIQEYLDGLGLPVPKVYEYLQSDGVLIIEDLGDATLEAHLRNTDLDQAGLWYDKAVDLLATLQNRAILKKTPAFERRFDVAKLMWEFDFMLEHYVSGFMKRPLSGSLQKKLRDEMTALCTRLEAIEPCYCHRDYHSRNLMIRGEELVMIDFQDARLGPPQYDLASLLRDTYCPLPEKMVQEKIDRFVQKREESEGGFIDREAFDKGFDLMAIQRGLKAVGTFAYQKIENGNPRYEQYIAPTLANVKHSLDRHPDLSELKDALQDALPALEHSSPLS